MNGLDILGASFDFTPVASAAGGAAGSFLADRSANKRADIVIKADAAATTANAEALFTAYYAKDGNPANIAKANAAQLVADTALRAQDDAGLDLPPAAVKKRVAAADEAAKKAAAAALAAAAAVVSAPNDKDKAMAANKASALAKAASITADKARGVAMTGQQMWDPNQPVGGKSALSFLHELYGGMELWKWGAGVGTLGIGGLILWRVLR